MSRQIPITAGRTMETPRAERATLVLLGIGVFILLFARAMTRQSDPDEHQFVAPAMLLNDSGLQPYRDYPLFHMPMLVWIYAPLVRLSENALFIARALSALMGAVTATMLFGATRSFLSDAAPRTRRSLALCVVALFLGARVFTYTNGWSWNHDAAITPLVAAVLLQLRAMRTARTWPLLAVGVLLGVSMSIRLTSAPAAGALALCGLLLPGAMSLSKRVLGGMLAGVGWLLAMAPTIWLAAGSPEQFWFGNFGYPALYRQYVLERGTHQTGVFGKLGHFFQTWCTDPGNAAVLTLLALALTRLLRAPRPTGPGLMRVLTLLALMPALWIGVAAPFQIQMQYHSLLLPFFLLLIVAIAALESARSDFAVRWARPVGWATVLVVVVNFPRWYWQVVLLGSPSDWTPTRMMEDSRWIRGRLGKGALVLTTDPIVALQAGERTYPSLATGRFTFHVGPYMTDAQRIRYGIAWGPQLESMLAASPPDAVLYATWIEPLAAPLADAARLRGFERTVSPDGEYVLWMTPGPAGLSP